MRKSTLIVITGPTASGKSALAISLAQRLQTEIINADSRQIYQGIPIATATPTEEERDGITHHLLEFLPLDGYYSAATFQEDASRLLQEIFVSHDTAIVCGGSMLYTDALMYGIDNLPTVPGEIRNNLTHQWKENGDEWLISRLKDLDPDFYCKVDLKNLKRVFHAVEITLTGGKPYSQMLTGRNNNIVSPYKVVKIFLNGERQLLFNRINHRVMEMVRMGLEEEARSVYHLKNLNSLNTVGLKEMFNYFEGVFTFDQAVARIQKNTRVYAKKQITWHKRDTNNFVLDFSYSEKENVEKILSLI